MATLAAPTTVLSRVTDILELARTTLRHHRDHDLAQKIMVLHGYLELSGINRDRSYDDVIRKAFDKLLTALVDVHLEGEIDRHPNEKPGGTVFRQAATCRG